MRMRVPRAFLSVTLVALLAWAAIAFRALPWRPQAKTGDIHSFRGTGDGTRF